MKKINHTPGPWAIDAKNICDIQSVGENLEIATTEPMILCGGITPPRIKANTNAQLISLAPSSPHECDDPKCPGNVNRVKLEMFDEIVDHLIQNIKHNIKNYIGCNFDCKKCIVGGIKKCLPQTEIDLIERATGKKIEDVLRGE